MGVFKLGGMTLRSLFGKAPTRKYPYETRDPFERTRGQIDMTDIHDCIYCGMCERKCPADAIVVSKAECNWTYWPYKCVACDACVRTCPKKILVMKQERPTVTTNAAATVYYGLTEEERAEKARIEAEKKAKAKAAAEARKAAKAAEAGEKEQKEE